MQERTLFELLVLSLANECLVGLGILPEPGTTRISRNLEMSKHNLDILVMLQEKTKDNLTEDEEKLVNTVLYDLRVKLIEAQKKV